jgi:RNA polymerase sigma-70 factor (ECF subfamily)
VDPRLLFEQMYRAHADAVKTYARRRSDAQTADEVVGDVFLVAWRRLAEVPDDPLPWLLGVARRALANRRRTVAREQALHGRIQSELAASAAESLTGAGSDERVFGALRRLDERDREVLLLVAWEGLTPAQGAAVIGVRPNTFSTRLSRARRRFQRELAADQSEVTPDSKARTTEPSR